MRPVEKDLERLLQRRVDGFKADMRLKMGIVLGFFLLTIILGIAILRSIKHPIGDLIDTIRRFQDGDYASPVAHAAKQQRDRRDRPVPCSSSSSSAPSRP